MRSFFANRLHSFFWSFFPVPAPMESHGLATVVLPVDVFLAREVLEKNGLVPLDQLLKQGLWNTPKPRETHSAGEIADLFLRHLQPLFKTP